MGDDKNKKLEGGRDKTKLNKQSGPTYTVRIVFHSASNLLVADFGSRQSDPYVLAQLDTGVPTRHSTDPPLRFRSATVYRSTNPVWEAEWVVAGVPARGAELKARVYDEDKGTHDDRLGTVHIHTGALQEGYAMRDRTFELRKRGANWRALGLQTCLKPCVAEARRDESIKVSIEVLGRTENECGKVYTINSFWWIHYSPLMGIIAGTKAPKIEEKVTGGHREEKESEEANFQANQLQLCGPVPNELYHRYVLFRPVIKTMFEAKGLRGRAMHKLLHRQHERVYHFDSSTKYGRLPGPGDEMTRRFLSMADWGEGHRIFTYIITLDGLMLFTETGPEFRIDMLSKHTMHSDVNIYIAFSGEFYVRRWRPERHDGDESGSEDVELEQDQVDDANGGQYGNQPGGSGTRRHGRIKGARANGIKHPDGPAAEGGTDANGNRGGESEPGRNREASGSGGDSSHVVRPDAGSNGNGPNGTRGDSVQEQKKKKTRIFESPNGRAVEHTEIPGPESPSAPTDPASYELVIDNDSGTYRPDKELLSTLQAFLSAQFPGLHVFAKGCDDDAHEKTKKKRAEKKQKETGGRVYANGSDSSALSSLSSLDSSDGEPGKVHRSGKEKGVEFVEDPKAAIGKYVDGVFHHHSKEKSGDKEKSGSEEKSGDKGGDGTGHGEMSEKAHA